MVHNLKFHQGARPGGLDEGLCGRVVMFAVLCNTILQFAAG